MPVIPWEDQETEIQETDLFKMMSFVGEQLFNEFGYPSQMWMPSVDYARLYIGSHQDWVEHQRTNRKTIGYVSYYAEEDRLYFKAEEDAGLWQLQIRALKNILKTIKQRWDVQQARAAREKSDG